MTPTEQTFGGAWTEDKLETIAAYLVQYARIMHNQSFRFAYVDAFAGSGYRKMPRGSTESDPFFPNFAERENRELFDGSARRALGVRPHFDEYRFIERSSRRAAKLQSLREEFPELASRIVIEVEDANVSLQRFCAREDWAKRRAVIFLDPYGMQVEWRTIEAIAGTKGVDLWILFPVSGLNRLLVGREREMPEAWRTKLDRFFGTNQWAQSFYEATKQPDLFEATHGAAKTATFDGIGHFFVSRLREAFPHVAKTPRVLYSSSGAPLFLLCFAAANEKGGEIALRIAGHLLKKK